MIIYYDESVLTYAASIRKYYGLDSSYKADENFSKLLSTKKPKKMILILIDALGLNLLERKLPKDAFLRKHLTYKTTTVFPPTTTAATIAIMTGKSPNELAWLGWQQYFKEYDDHLIPFVGLGFYSHKNYGFNTVYDILPYKDIVEELDEKGLKTRILYNFRPEEHAKTIRSFTSRIKEMAKQDYKFVYAYYDGLDTLMHYKGPNSKEADKRFLLINDSLENLANSLDEDTMMVVLADHGQIEVKEHIDLYKTPLNKYFRLKPGLESRTVAFYIKEGCLEKFEKEFKERYEDKFILLDKQQVLYTHLFGDHQNHERFEEFIGDFMAIAKSDAELIYSDGKRKKMVKGHHAGMLKDEIMVPVITYMK